jgi:xanthine dehydrogenase small subunit
VAGGTDLYVQQPERLPENELLFLSRREGFSGVWPSAERLFIGAGTTASALIESPLLAAALPSLAGALRQVAATQVRNRATLGGNIVNASPIGDMSIIFLALDARVGLRGGKANRVLPLSDFFLGYKQLALRQGELVAWISVPLRFDGVLFHFEKVARRRSQDIAAVNSAIAVELSGKTIVRACVSAGGVAPVPLRLRAAEAFLAGRKPSPAVFRKMAVIAAGEIAPISDVRGSAAYKRTLLDRLLAAHFLALFPDAFAPGDLP